MNNTQIFFINLIYKKKLDILYVMEKDEKKIEKTIPDIDTSRFIIKQKLKLDTTRYITPIVTITEKDRKQFRQGGNEPSYNAILAEKARNAIKIAENHIKEEALKQEKLNKEKTGKSTETSIELANDIKDGNFEKGFNALTGSSSDLKEIK